MQRSAYSDQDVLSEMTNFLLKLDNNEKSAKKCVDFISDLILRRKIQGTIPLIEFITIIKVEKPLTYTFLKKISKSNTRLRMLIDVSTDYNQAKTIIFGKSIDKP